LSGNKVVSLPLTNGYFDVHFMRKVVGT